MIKEPQTFSKCQSCSWNVIYSMIIHSLRRFNLCLMFSVFLVFQFRRIVFLIIGKAMSTGFEFWIGGFIIERSPSRQRDGDMGNATAHS